MDPLFEKNLADTLASFSNIEFAMVFGSVARGRNNPDSDLDIAVLADKPLDSSLKMELIAKLAEKFGRPVDLVDLRTVGEPLLGEVLKGQPIMGSSETHARLMSRHLIDQADFSPLQRRLLKERREKWINS